MTWKKMDAAEADQQTTLNMAAADNTSTSSGFFEGEELLFFVERHRQ